MTGRVSPDIMYDVSSIVENNDNSEMDTTMPQFINLIQTGGVGAFLPDGKLYMIKAYNFPNTYIKFSLFYDKDSSSRFQLEFGGQVTSKEA